MVAVLLEVLIDEDFELFHLAERVYISRHGLNFLQLLLLLLELPEPLVDLILF